MVALGTIPGHALFFAVYEASYSFLNVSNHELKPVTAAWTGALATLMHDFIETPADLIKQRMQIAENDASAMRILRNLIRTEGFFGLFRSLPITLVFRAISLSD